MTKCSMSDPNVSLLNTLAVLCWLGGVAVLVVNMFVDPDVHSFGVVLCGVGGVLTIRAFVHQLEEREKAAFEVGRELGAAQAQDATPFRRPARD